MTLKKYNAKKSLYEAKKAREVLDMEFTEFLPKKRNVQEFFDLYNTHFYNISKKTHKFFIEKSLKYLVDWTNPREITKRDLQSQVDKLKQDIASIEQKHPIIPNGTVLSPNEESEYSNLDACELYFLQSNQLRLIGDGTLFNQIKEFLKKSDTPDEQFIIRVDRGLLNTIKTGKEIKTEQDIYDSNYKINTYNQTTETTPSFGGY